MVERYSYKVDVLGSNPSRRTAAGERRKMKLQSFMTLLLRVSLGWLFLYAGYSKLIVTGGFSAKQFLLSLHGPFSSLYLPLAGNPLVDTLVVTGELAIGFCLIFGILVRFASFWGVVMLVLFYLAGYPPEHSFIVNEQFMYILVFAYLFVSKSGLVYGLDKTLEKKFPKLKKFMG